MNVEVRLFATFREGREKKQIIKVSENTSVIDILNLLNIKKEEVAILLVNGMDSYFEYNVKDGDVLSIFPPVGGG